MSLRLCLCCRESAVWSTVSALSTLSKHKQTVRCVVVVRVKLLCFSLDGGCTVWHILRLRCHGCLLLIVVLCLILGLTLILVLVLILGLRVTLCSGT